jgi:hypothetical protein
MLPDGQVFVWVLWLVEGQNRLPGGIILFSAVDGL